MQADERKLLILQAIIDDYINTAMPVGSRTISRKAGVGFSPATIRNEMSDLEELGYLSQPHTSAGRVPSDKAYRLYVDRLLKVGKLPEDERARMHDSMQLRAAQVDGIIRSAAQQLSDATGYTSVIIAPKLNTLHIRHIQLVPVSDDTALLIMVTNLGVVKDSLIRMAEPLNADELYVLSRMLTGRLADRPLDEVHQAFAEILAENAENRRLLVDTLRVIARKLEAEDSSEVVVGGRTKLLEYPEYADMDRARELLSVLESGEKLRGLFESDRAQDFSIRIGMENGLPELSDCSVVSALYDAGDGATGTMGIIGPMRMNYNRVIPVLQYVSRAVSEMLGARVSMARLDY